jgi:hypothetical protein
MRWMTLAVVLLLTQPGNSVSGPPQGLSGRMVYADTSVRTSDGMLIIRQTANGAVLQGRDIQAKGARIIWDKSRMEIIVEGTEARPAVWSQVKIPGDEPTTTETNHLNHERRSLIYHVKNRYLRVE